MTQDKIHSKIGASSMERWEACPGSVRLSEGVEGEDSAYAKEGTVAHSVAEDCIKTMCLNNPPMHPFEFAGEIRDGVEVTEEMCEAVLVYIDAVQKVAKKGAIVKVESRLHLKAIDNDLFGTSDCSVYVPSEKTLYSIDYKHGAWLPVDVEGNPQLLYYALGAMLERPLDVEFIELMVVQPRCFHPQGPVRSWRISIHDLIEWSFKLEAAAKATKDPNAPFSPGEHCRWCPAAGFCRTLEETCMSIYEENKDTTKYDPEHLADVYEKLGLVDTWIKSVRGFCYREALAGRVIPNHKLVDGRKSREFKDRKEAIDFLKMYGLEDADIFTKPDLKSVAQIEKVIGAKHKADLKPLVDEKVGNKRLVSDKADGDAIDTSPENAFSSFLD